MTYLYETKSLDGYQRDEYRTCELYWPNATKHLEKLQKTYQRVCPKSITFTYLHSADFDCYGNLIPNVHAKENRERVRVEMEKLRNENEFLRSLPDNDFQSMEYRTISAYEAHFTRKSTKRFI